MDAIQRIESILNACKQTLRSSDNATETDLEQSDGTESEIKDNQSLEFEDKAECKQINIPSPSASSMEEGVDEELFDEKEMEHFELLPLETKRAMMTAHYISRRLHSYFKKYHFCAHDECHPHYIDIVKHLYIVGGAVRNYLIDATINDLDLMVDTLKLQQLQSQHLLRYHEVNGGLIGNEEEKDIDIDAKEAVPVIAEDGDYGLDVGSRRYNEWTSRKKRKCKCLWYLQFYRLISIEKRCDIKDHDNAAEDEWIFNAKTISRILVNEMKRDCKQRSDGGYFNAFIDKHNVIKITIKTHLKVNGIDLYGQHIDICDATDHSFHRNQSAKYRKASLHEYRQKYPHRITMNNMYFYYRYNPQSQWIQKLKKGTIRRHFVENNNYHRCTLKEDVINRDFTINSLLLPLNKVITKRQCFKWRTQDLVDYVDGFKDIQQKLFAVSPQNTIQHILESSPIRILRCFKYYLQFKQEFSISEQVRNGIVKHRELLYNMSSTAIQQVLMPLVEGCKSNVNETKLLLQILEEYHLNKILIEIMVREQGFIRHFLNVLFLCDPPIQSIYTSYQYPSALTVAPDLLPKALKSKNKETLRCDYNMYKACYIIDCLLKHI